MSNFEILKYFFQATHLIAEQTVPKPRFEAAPLPGVTIDIVVPATDWLWHRRLSAEAGHEVPICRWLQSNISSGDVFFDVGAHYGFYSLLASSLESTVEVHAFEPNPKQFRYLQTNCENNGYRNRWELIDRALSTVQTPYSLTLDDYCRHRDVVPSLLKIDVEGFELLVLDETEDVIERRETTFLIELHPKQIRCHGGSVDQLLEIFPDDYTLRFLPDVRGEPSAPWTTELSRANESPGQPFLYAAPRNLAQYHVMSTDS